jgi:putative ABC transport system permease protein
MLVTGLGVGLVPALQFTRGDLAEPLKDAGRGSSAGRKRQRLRASLVVIEIALATMLLAGTGLLARSLLAMQRAQQGFDPQNVYLNNVGLGGKKYGTGPQVTAFMEEAMARIGTLPGVRAVAFAGGLPMMGQAGLLFKVDGTPDLPVRDMLHTADTTVTPDYFKAMGIPLVRGRTFTAQDTAGAPRVIIVNQEMVRRHFSNTDPIGQRLMIMTMADKPDVVREIVGVVGDVRSSGPQSKLEPQVYEPRAQVPLFGANHLVIKADGEAPALNSAVGEVIRSMDADLPYRNLRPYTTALSSAWMRQRFTLILFAMFSGISLLLAAIGIYGVMNYAVSQRTQEIGIRMALGARARDVLAMIFRNGARIVALGLVLGIAGSAAFARVLRSLLFNTSEIDPLNFSAVALLLAVVALLACVLPARRATKVDPIIALRAE